MFLRLLALFTLVPLLELFLLVELGKRMGFVPTLALVLFTGVLGAALARSQGLRVLRQVQAEVAKGNLPTEALLDGLMIFIAGAVLLTPGLLTALTGFFLLLPFGRRLIRRQVSRRLEGRFRTVRPMGRPPFGDPWTGPASQPDGSRPDGSRPKVSQQVIIVDHRAVDEPTDDTDDTEDDRRLTD